MFWLRNKKNDFLLRTLIWGLEIIQKDIMIQNALSPYVPLPVLYVQQIYIKVCYMTGENPVS